MQFLIERVILFTYVYHVICVSALKTTVTVLDKKKLQFILLERPDPMENWHLEMLQTRNYWGEQVW